MRKITTKEYLEVEEQLRKGGDWLGKARGWMQRKIRGGDTLFWSSSESVSVPFYELEELARRAAVAAVLEDREMEQDPALIKLQNIAGAALVLLEQEDIEGALEQLRKLKLSIELNGPRARFVVD